MCGVRRSPATRPAPRGASGHDPPAPARYFRETPFTAPRRTRLPIGLFHGSGTSFFAPRLGFRSFFHGRVKLRPSRPSAIALKPAAARVHQSSCPPADSSPHRVSAHQTASLVFHAHHRLRGPPARHVFRASRARAVIRRGVRGRSTSESSPRPQSHPPPLRALSSRPNLSHSATGSAATTQETPAARPEYTDSVLPSTTAFSSCLAAVNPCSTSRTLDRAVSGERNVVNLFLRRRKHLRKIQRNRRRQRSRLPRIRSCLDLLRKSPRGQLPHRPGPCSPCCSSGITRSCVHNSAQRPHNRALRHLAPQLLHKLTRGQRVARNQRLIHLQPQRRNLPRTRCRRRLLPRLSPLSVNT